MAVPRYSFSAAAGPLPAPVAARVAEACRDWQGGGSILGLMMLGAARGDCVQLQVSGESAEERLAQLVAMIEDGFGED